jgi:hypothetical protein
MPGASPAEVMLMGQARGGHVTSKSRYNAHRKDMVSAAPRGTCTIAARVFFIVSSDMTELVEIDNPRMLRVKNDIFTDFLFA